MPALWRRDESVRYRLQQLHANPQTKDEPPMKITDLNTSALTNDHGHVMREEMDTILQLHWGFNRENGSTCRPAVARFKSVDDLIAYLLRIVSDFKDTAHATVARSAQKMVDAIEDQRNPLKPYKVLFASGLWGWRNARNPADLRSEVCAACGSKALFVLDEAAPLVTSFRDNGIQN